MFNKPYLILYRPSEILRAPCGITESYFGKMVKFLKLDLYGRGFNLMILIFNFKTTLLYGYQRFARLEI